MEKQRIWDKAILGDLWSEPRKKLMVFLAPEFFFRVSSSSRIACSLLPLARPRTQSLTYLHTCLFTNWRASLQLPEEHLSYRVDDFDSEIGDSAVLTILTRLQDAHARFVCVLCSCSRVGVRFESSCTFN